MKPIRLSAAAVLLALALLVPGLAAAAEEAPLPLGMSVPHLNLVLAVTDEAKTLKFYGEILGLKRIPNLHLPNNVEMIRYMGGKSEIKLIVNNRPLPKSPGGVTAARGIRMMAILLPAAERDGILERMEGHGLPRPTFNRPEGASFEWGLVSDLDDNVVEVVFIDDGAPESVFDSFQIGLTVSDTEAMREFIGKVLGLDELDPEPLGGGATKYSFKVGTSTIKFWGTGENVPAVVGDPFSGIGYRMVQFLVRDVAAVHETLVSRGAKVARGPFPLGTMASLLFIEGPDGIYFEFAGPLIRP